MIQIFIAAILGLSFATGNAHGKEKGRAPAQNTSNVVSGPELQAARTQISTAFRASKFKIGPRQYEGDNRIANRLQDLSNLACVKDKQFNVSCRLDDSTFKLDIDLNSDGSIAITVHTDSNGRE